jgi:hypothetical protein
LPAASSNANVGGTDVTMDTTDERDRRRVLDLERELRELRHDVRALHYRVAEIEHDRDQLRAAFRVIAFAGMEGQRSNDLEKAS